MRPQLLNPWGLSNFLPRVTACPVRPDDEHDVSGGRADSSNIRERMPEWKQDHEGVESMTLAVMGCVVNGPGESKAANIGISLPGTGEAPNCPIYVDGDHVTTLRGTYDELSEAFRRLIDDYVERKYPRQVHPSRGLKPPP